MISPPQADRTPLKFLLPFFCLCFGCGGGGGDDQTKDFTGTWEATYNLQGADDCGLVTEGIIAFIDRQKISDKQTSVLVSSAEGLVMKAVGAKGADATSFTAVDRRNENTFGDDIVCSRVTTVSYESIESDKADSTFGISITCADGFKCVSHAVGTSMRISDKK